MEKRNITPLEAAINPGDVARRVLGEVRIGELEVAPDTEASEQSKPYISHFESAKSNTSHFESAK